jgi:hypothetical protein
MKSHADDDVLILLTNNNYASIAFLIDFILSLKSKNKNISLANCVLEILALEY